MQNNFKELNRKLDITEIASKLGLEIRRNMVVCPFHDDNKPSMIINEERNSYRCFACDLGGDAIDLYSKIKGVSMAEAANDLAKTYSLGMQFNTGHTIDMKIEPLLGTHAEYLKSRGIESGSFKRYELGSCGDSVRIPLRDENKKLVGWQDKGTRVKTFGFSPGFSPSKYLGNLDKVLGSYHYTLVTESFLDCILADQEDIPCVCTFKNSMSTEQASKLINSFSRIVLAFDNDPAGHSGAIKAYKNLKSLNPIKQIMFADFKGADLGDHFYNHDSVREVTVVEWAYNIGMNYEEIVTLVRSGRSFVERRLYAMEIAEKFSVQVSDVFHDMNLQT